MIALEITHNGEKKLVVGDESLVSLSAAILAFGKFGAKTTRGGDPFGSLCVTGVSEASDGKPQQMLHWEGDFKIFVDDVVTMRFIEVEGASPPKHVGPFASEEPENAQQGGTANDHVRHASC